jgi:hypothetical protein
MFDEPEYQHLLNGSGPHRYLAQMALASVAGLSEEEQKKQAEKAKRLVLNDFVPTGFRGSWKNDERNWYTSQFAQRAITRGWKPPTDAQITAFVQGLYTLGSHILTPPPKGSELLASIDGACIRHGVFI